MLIVYIAIMFFNYKYLPILKNKVNYIYQEKFNITIFSKENFKRPFIASILILFGNFYKSSKGVINLGTILIVIGICIMLYVIYDTYKKTDFLYGTIAAGIYLFALGLQILFGIMMIALVMMSIVFMAMEDNRSDHY